LSLLHFIMAAPVWHLISRIDLAGGSTGWHRFYLIDATVRHFGDWWFVGFADVGRWGVENSDVTNQYVLTAVRGGVLTLALMVVLIAMEFRVVGYAWRNVGKSRVRVAVAWGLGVAFAVHCTSFWGVSYFGQIILLWHMLLATLSSLHQFSRANRQVRISEGRLGDSSSASHKGVTTLGRTCRCG
jgi:hypothetical protein